MDKIWLTSYPPGAPAEVDPTPYRSLVQLLEDAFHQFADRNAYVCMDKFLTYAEVDACSRRIGAWLQSRAMKQGARVGVMLPNVLQYPIAIAAILRAGYVVVNIDPLHTPRALEQQLTDAGCEAIILLENFAHTLEEILGRTSVKHIIVASTGEMLGAPKGLLVNFVVRNVKRKVPPFSLPNAVRFKDALSHSVGMKLTPVALQPTDPAFLQYTSGTGGTPKGAMLTHRNLIANLLQGEAWNRAALGEPGQLEEQLVIVTALPLCQPFGLMLGALWGLRAGALNVLIPHPRDVGGFVRELAKYRFHLLPGTNTLYQALLNHPDFMHVDFSALRLCHGVGMPLRRSVGKRWQEVTGSTIIACYGLTEASPLVACNRSDLQDRGDGQGDGGVVGNGGLPLPSTEIAILDDGGAELGPGQRGEIAIRGPQVMSGYWNRPDETAKAMTADGYFKSGDIGVLDARGYLTVIERSKDVIRVAGVDVYPSELEAVIAGHPGVRECACIGVPDEQLGEAVKACVVRRDPTLTADTLLAYCRQLLNGGPLPHTIEFREELPKTHDGMMLRRTLRDESTNDNKKAA